MFGNRKYNFGGADCSGEGHVSYILSSRLGWRLLGWCRIEADQMFRLRIFVANGRQIYDLFLEKKRATVKIP